MRDPVGIQNFEKLRKGKFLYVDKTKLMYRLVDEGQYYFLSRPRRFGKSLLISTLEAYFSGKKELFEGLAIYDLEQDWLEYPILHIDLNTANFRERAVCMLYLTIICATGRRNMASLSRKQHSLYASREL